MAPVATRARAEPISVPMPEILTESFCERCGTRYTFETGEAQPKRPTIAKARILARGLKNFVMSNDPLEAALADARRDDERARAAVQMEAFHQTFNFCMDCRQYTCTSCWNEGDGRCLTCAPMPDRIERVMAELEPLAAPLPEAAANGHEREEAWPSADLPTVEEPVAIVEAVTVAAEPEPAAVVEAEAAAVVDAVAEATADTYLPELLTPDELAEEEPAEVQGVAEPEPEPEVVAAAEPEPEVVAAAEPEPEVVAAAEPVPEVVAAAEPVPEVVAAAVEPEAEVVESPAAPEAPLAPPPPSQVAPAWTMVAPEAPSAEPTPPWPPQAPVYQPPAAPPRPTPSPAAPVPSWPRPATPAFHALPPAPSVWEVSSVVVVNRPGSGVQACVSCGLPLSASARFCRRCGSRQE